MAKANGSRDNHDNHVNQRLRNERTRRHWSQQELADRVGTTLNTISRWERGITLPGPYFRTRICDLFEKPPEELGLIAEDAGATIPAAVLYDPAIPAAPRLVGRDSLLQQIKQRLCPGTPQRAVALHGLPGAGKTALALALAHDSELLERFCDGILWAGLGPQPHILGLLARWGSLLGMAESEMAKLQSVDAWALTLRTLIGTRRMLLVLDDAWRIEDALMLQVGGLHCACLLTTRFTDLALQYADEGMMSVPELSEEDGVRLLAHLAPQAMQAEPESVRALVQAAGGLPLAITLVGKYLRLQTHSHQPRRLAVALERLRSVEQRFLLAQPHAPLERPPAIPAEVPLSLQTSIALSEQRLDAQARAALRALSAFPAKPATFSEEAALAVIAAPVDALDRLSDAGLLECYGPGRYTLHQVIADYARLHRDDRDAEKRLVEYYARYAEHHATDYAALEQECAAICAALEIAFDQGLLPLLIRTGKAFASFLEARGLHALAAHHLKRATDAARSLGDTDSLMRLLLHLGRFACQRGEYTQAESYLHEGLMLARQAADERRIICALTELSEVLLNHGLSEQAESYLHEGLMLARRSEGREQLCGLLRLLGLLAVGRKDFEQAGTCLQEALELARQINDQEQLCRSFTALAMMAWEQGDTALADRYSQASLSLARQLDNRERTSVLLLYQSLTAQKRGDHAQVDACAQEGLRLARQIGNPEVIASLLLLLGGSALLQQAYAQAETYLQEAVAIARLAATPHTTCLVLVELGELQLRQQQPEAAASLFREALSSAQGDHDLIARAQYGFARVAAAQGNIDAARELGLTLLNACERDDPHLLHKVRRWLNALPVTGAGSSFPAASHLDGIRPAVG